MSEQLFDKKNEKLVLFPINEKYSDIWELYKRAQSSFWIAEEIDFNKDKNDWNLLNENERKLLKEVLCFFAASDSIVADNISDNFMDEITIREVKIIYTFQEMIENIHSETYSLMLNALLTNDEIVMAQNAIINMDGVKAKAEWTKEMFNKEKYSFVERLIASIIVEGIFFSGSFCSIFWMKERGLLPGVCMANEFISRDENLHVETACCLYVNHIKNKLVDYDIHKLFESGVEVEKKFIVEAIKCEMIGMKKELMIQYIEYCADQILIMLNHKKLYNVNNPFKFMDLISVNSKANFFERRSSSYKKSIILHNNENEYDSDYDD